MSESKNGSLSLAHPLALSEYGQFSYDIVASPVNCLDARGIRSDLGLQAVLNSSVLHAVQILQFQDVESLGRLNLAAHHGNGPVEINPDAKANFVDKMSRPDEIADGVSWIVAKALEMYGVHHTKHHHGNAPKLSVAAFGLTNDGVLDSTRHFDEMLEGFPELLRDSGVHVMRVDRFDRDDPKTMIKHRVWPVGAHIDPVAFYVDKKAPDFLTLRRRRPIDNIFTRLGHTTVILERYKESFALINAQEFQRDIREEYDSAFRHDTNVNLDGMFEKESEVAKLCGLLFRSAIDSGDESGKMVVPTYTQMKLRISNPFIHHAAGSHNSPVHPHMD